MIGIAVLSAVLAAGCPPAAASVGYGGGYVAAAPVYSTGYAKSYSYAVKTQYVPVYADPYYARAIGEYVDGEVAKASLTDELRALREEIKLARQAPQQPVQRFEAPPQYIPAPSPQQPVQAPRKAAPSKQGPGQGYYPAPLPPEVNPQPGGPGEVQEFGDVPPGDPSASLNSLLGSRCASCHTSGQSPRKGFVLFDQGGNLVASASDLFRAQRAVDRQLMPAGAPLSDDEAERLGNAIGAYLSQASR